MSESLVFRAIDRHVIHGRADELAVAGAGRSLTYAQLLHDSACIAAALREIGVAAGSSVSVDLPARREHVIAVLACARLGVELAPEADVRLAGEPPVLTTADTQVPWNVLLHAGRLDPVPTPERDPEGYEQRIVEQHPELFGTLLAGDTVI